MGVFEGRTFRNGDGIWVELPAEFGFTADMPIQLEGDRASVTIRPTPLFDPVAEKRKVVELVKALRALGPPLPRQPREPIEFPERSGL